MVGPGGMAKAGGSLLDVLKNLKPAAEQIQQQIDYGVNPAFIDTSSLDLPENPLVIAPDIEYHPAGKQQQEEIKKEKNKQPKKRKPHSPEKTAQDKGYKLGEKAAEKVSEDTDWGLVGTIAVGALVVFYLMYQASSSGR